jgi:thioredoxin 1
MNNPPAKAPGASPPWLLFLGLMLGGAFVVYMAWSSFTTSRGRSSRHVIELTSENWQEEVVNSKIPVLVDFWADWCGPCLQLAPTIDRLADKYQGKIKVGKVNVDHAGGLAQKYGVRAIPVVMIFRGGQEPWTRIDNNSVAAIESAIKRSIAEK